MPSVKVSMQPARSVSVRLISSASTAFGRENRAGQPGPGDGRKRPLCAGRITHPSPFLWPEEPA